MLRDTISGPVSVSTYFSKKSALRSFCKYVRILDKRFVAFARPCYGTVWYPKMKSMRYHLVSCRMSWRIINMHSQIRSDIIETVLSNCVRMPLMILSESSSYTNNRSIVMGEMQ
jgi:hypothetical protein